MAAPRTAADLSRHRLVVQVADQIPAKEVFESWFPGQSLHDMLVMKTNVSSANY